MPLAIPVQQEVARKTSMPLFPKNWAFHLLRGECQVVRIGKKESKMVVAKRQGLTTVEVLRARKPTYSVWILMPENQEHLGQRRLKSQLQQPGREQIQPSSSFVFYEAFDPLSDVLPHQGETSAIFSPRSQMLIFSRSILTGPSMVFKQHSGQPSPNQCIYAFHRQHKAMPTQRFWM